MSRDTQLRSHLVDLLTARQAHCTFDEAVADLPAEARGQRPDDLPYSVWEQVEHLRRAQRDILDFCRDPEYTQPAWPDDYWPDSAAPADEAAWTDSVEQVQDDLQAMCGLVQNPSLNLYEEIPHGDGQTYLREAMLVADHNAYHIGQIVTIRRALDAWGDRRES
jgi:uncharacterized damage-inducible protein DinB